MHSWQMRLSHIMQLVQEPPHAEDFQVDKPGTGSGGDSECNNASTKLRDDKEDAGAGAPAV